VKNHAKRLAGDFAVTAIAICIGLILIFPIIYCVFGAFKTPAEFMSPKLLPDSFAYKENFTNALNQAPLLRYMVNSFIVAFFGTVIRLVLSVMAAYVFTHYEFRLKNLCFFLVLGTMMMPGDILLVTNYMTVSKLGLINTYLGMCIVSFVSASQMFMLRQRFLSVPRDMRHAAMIDGCGDVRYILTVLMPICKPIITTLFVQSFITLWNTYLWPLIITASSPEMRTIMVGITKLNSWEDTNYELVLAGVTISLIPSLLLFLGMRRNMRKGGMDGALVG
jgi:sn-glycerol 3-phosphate transport system permease protein